MPPSVKVTCLNGFFSARTARLNFSIPRLAMLEWQTTSIHRNPKFHLAGSSVFAPAAGMRLCTFVATSDIGQPKQGHRPRALFSAQSPQWRRASGRCAVRCVGHLTEANIGVRPERRTWGKGRRTSVFGQFSHFHLKDLAIRAAAKLFSLEHFRTF